MLFNSVEFLIFLPIVFGLYWFLLKKIHTQNILILLASYVFYGWWDWRFLSLILLSTLVDYTVGVNLGKTSEENKRKRLLWISVLFNLGLLGTFKYFNFFIDNWISLWNSLGIEMNRVSINVILPVGISFYTFQTLSYTLDIYKKQLTPTRNFFAFASFVAFFPQLVAGPIERASNLLPQFFKVRKFTYAKAADGLRQILWGLFKKVVIADNCAEYVNIIFADYHDYSGSTLVLGAVLFAFQIYGDFSGYSDIAIGVARLFGFELKQNFAFPYFSRDISEFWRRWHISLSTWFRDYLYIPLGGSRVNNAKKLRNIFIIFVVSGFWHGANWTFIVWGALNALFFLPLIFLEKNRVHLNVVAENRLLPTLKESLQILFTFTITTFAWIFFRAENIHHAMDFISTIFSTSIFTIPEFNLVEITVLLFFFLVVEWIGRKEQYAIEKCLIRIHYSLRWSFYLILLVMIFTFGKDANEFIYFQF
jgi:D-alanyl-lipoteichoic acid acyltransferase DltB (MBOAT superfamily)